MSTHTPFECVKNLCVIILCFNIDLIIFLHSFLFFLTSLSLSRSLIRHRFLTILAFSLVFILCVASFRFILCFLFYWNKCCWHCIRWTIAHRMRARERDIRFAWIVDVRDFVTFQWFVILHWRNRGKVEAIQVIVGDNTIFVLFSLFSAVLFLSLSLFTYIFGKFW